MPDATDFDLESGSEVRVIASSKPKVNWSFIIFIIIVVTVGVVLVFQKDDKKVVKEKNLERASEAFKYIDEEETKLVKLGYFLPPGTGRIIPHWDYEWTATSRIKGTVVLINKRVNDSVKTGDVIVVLENAELAKIRLQTQIAVEQARKRLKYVESMQADVEFHELSEAVKNAEIERDKIKNQLDLSLPFEGLTISSLEINNLTKELEFANRMLNRETAVLKGFNRRIKDEILEQAKNLETLLQDLQIIDARIESLEIKAPENLKLLEIHVQKGQTVSEGDKIFTLYDPMHVNVSLLASYVNFSRFSIGRKAKIFIDADPNNSYPGEVIAMHPLSDQKKNNFDVIIKFLNPDEKVLIGCTAQIEFKKEK